MRKQNSIISSPEQLMPIDYFKYINDHALHNQDYKANEEIISELFNYLHFVLDYFDSNPEHWNLLLDLQLEKFIASIRHYFKKRDNEIMYYNYMEIRKHLNIVRSQYSKYGFDEELNDTDE